MKNIRVYHYEQQLQYLLSIDVSNAKLHLSSRNILLPLQSAQQFLNSDSPDSLKVQNNLLRYNREQSSKTVAEALGDV